jgi:tetratricopeptide (TPR) repeat protein
MKKIESLFISISLFAILIATAVATWQFTGKSTSDSVYHFPNTQYGAFLAAQHAIYANDFENALSFTQDLQDIDITVVNNTKILSQFLGGKMPQDVRLLKNEKSIPAKFIYEAWLVKNDNWKEMHNRHKNDTSALIAPFRIWSAIANDWRTNTFKYIDKLPVNDSWREFVRGQIYAELGDIDKAAKHFDAVNQDFMNINDYLYIMSFYTHHNMSDRAEELKTKYTTRPAGMFLMNFDKIPDWSLFSGYKNALAFSLLQNVSHTQILMYSDMAMLMLRFAEAIAPEMTKNTDAINYYLGQFFYTNTGNYQHYFEKIEPNSPFYPFVALRNTEKTGNFTELEQSLRDFPLFVPSVNKLVGHYIKSGNKRAALRVVNRAINDKNINDAGRAFFAKTRAQIHYSFGDYDAAQSDIKLASDYLAVDAEIVSLQAKIWAAQNREIENAYQYAMTLVAQDPSDIMAWDTLGTVVAVREGAYAALEVLERVGEISQSHSPLYLHLGDIYVSIGEYDKAREAYMRAIDLSDDGLTVVPEIERKIRKLK